MRLLTKCGLNVCKQKCSAFFHNTFKYMLKIILVYHESPEKIHNHDVTSTNHFKANMFY